jgi:hypothetical protein
MRRGQERNQRLAAQRGVMSRLGTDGRSRALAIVKAVAAGKTGVMAPAFPAHLNQFVFMLPAALKQHLKK